MTLEQLRIFIEVAQRQHLTQAAAALALTPSAVSASIKSLEERYGTALFHRVGRRIETSEAGHIFLAEARRTVASARAAETTLAELGTLRRGALAIHASQTIASYWLPPLLVRFRQTWPSIELQVEMDNTENVARSVLQGTADIGFVEGDIGEIPLAKKIVGEDKLVVVVAPDHPWADGRALGPVDLAGAQWILREAGSGTRSAFEAAFGALGIPLAQLQVALSLPSNEAVRSAVTTGPFATAMSELVVAPQLEVGRLALAAFQLPTRAFSMLRHPERHHSRASLAFEQLVHTHAACD